MVVEFAMPGQQSRTPQDTDIGADVTNNDATSDDTATDVCLGRYQLFTSFDVVFYWLDQKHSWDTSRKPRVV